MKAHLAYGKRGLEIDIPASWDVTIIEPEFIPGIPDPNHALLQSLENPLDSLPLVDQINLTGRVGIVFSDITRPTPNHLILPAVLEVLGGLRPENIILFNAVGTHRHNTIEELRFMLGEDIVDRYRIIQNQAFDAEYQSHLGVSSFGHEIFIDRELLACDLKILTGFIEPHFFAGFSGGGKSAMPGMAGIETILGNHSVKMIDHPKSTWGITQENPIWEEIREIASKIGEIFLLNVTLNKHKQITGVFAGDLESAHAAGCAFVREKAMIAVEQPFDIVITSNSGYPLDINLYQSVKGMSAAAQIVRPGGAIIIAAECRDGIPEHGEYGKLLSKAQNAEELLEIICESDFSSLDQWQAQIHAQILQKARVFIYSENLSDGQINSALLQTSNGIEATVKNLLLEYGPQARICMLPEGPQTIPYLI